MRAGLTTGLITQSGSFFTLEGEKIGQGREAARKYLKDNPKILNKIEKLVIEKLKANIKAKA